MKIIKKITITILLMTALAFLSAIGDGIPPSLIENDVYTYIKEAASESEFLEAYNPAVKAGVLAMIKVEETREKPFCHSYRKTKILPRMYCEYIAYTRGDVEHVAVMAFNVTPSGRNCILIQINPMTEFIEMDILSNIKLLEKIGIDHPFYESRNRYTEIFTELIQTADFENFEISDKNERTKESEEGSMGGFKMSIAELLLQFRDNDNGSQLNPEVESLGYFQLSERYFCNVLLVHSDLFGYGVVTSLFKIENEKTLLVRLNFKSKAESLITNFPIFIDND